MAVKKQAPRTAARKAVDKAGSGKHPGRWVRGNRTQITLSSAMAFFVQSEARSEPSPQPLPCVQIYWWQNRSLRLEARCAPWPTRPKRLIPALVSAADHHRRAVPRRCRRTRDKASSDHPVRCRCRRTSDRSSFLIPLRIQALVGADPAPFRFRRGTSTMSKYSTRPRVSPESSAGITGESHLEIP